MTSAPRFQEQPWHEAEAEFVPARPVSTLAVVCAIVGVLSLLAFFDWSLIIFPIGTLVLAYFATRQIYQHEPPAIGLGGVRFALLLAAFGGIGGPVHLLTIHAFLQRESRPAAEQFLALLRAGKPHMAYQLTRDPNIRLPVYDWVLEQMVPDPAARDQLFWDAISKEEHTREEFEGFVGRTPVRIVLELKDRSHIRYLGTPIAQQRHGRYQVHHLYAVTYEHEGKRRTIVIALQLERQRLRDTRAADWVVTDVFGPVNPDEYP